MLTRRFRELIKGPWGRIGDVASLPPGDLVCNDWERGYACWK